MRIAYHLRYRAARLNYDIRPNEVYSSERFGMSMAAEYSRTLDAEAERCLSWTFRDICQRPMPMLFEHPELVGTLQLHESLASKPIIIPDTAIGRRKIWREIADLIRQSKQPLHLKEICQHIGTTDASHAAYHIRRAEAAGLIKKLGHQGGWVLCNNADHAVLSSHSFAANDGTPKIVNVIEHKKEVNRGRD